jgi:hypothetical protein
MKTECENKNMNDIYEMIADQLHKENTNPHKVLKALLINYIYPPKISFENILRHHKKFAKEACKLNLTKFVEKFIEMLNSNAANVFNLEGQFAKLLRTFFVFYPCYVSLINPNMVKHLNLYTHPVHSKIVVKVMIGNELSINKYLVNKKLYAIEKFPQNISIALKTKLICSLMRDMEHANSAAAASKAIVSMANDSNTRFKYYLITRLMDKFPLEGEQISQGLIDTAIKVHATITTDPGKNLFSVFLGLALNNKIRKPALVMISQLIGNMPADQLPANFLTNLHQLIISLDDNRNANFNRYSHALFNMETHIPDTEKMLIRNYLNRIDLSVTRHLIWEGMACLIIASGLHLTNINKANQFATMLISYINPANELSSRPAIKALNKLVLCVDPAYFSALARYLILFDGKGFTSVMNILLQIIPDVSPPTNLQILRKVFNNLPLTQYGDRILAEEVIKLCFVHLPFVEQTNTIDDLLQNIRQLGHSNNLIILKVIAGLIPEALLANVIATLVQRIATEVSEEIAGETLAAIITAQNNQQAIVNTQLFELLNHQTGRTKTQLALIISENCQNLSIEELAPLAQHIRASINIFTNYPSLMNAKICLELKKINASDEMSHVQLKCLPNLLNCMVSGCWETRKIARQAFIQWLPCFSEHEKENIVFPMFYGAYHKFHHTGKASVIVTAELNNLRNLIYSHQNFVPAINRHVLFKYPNDLQNKIAEFVSRSRPIMGNY